VNFNLTSLDEFFAELALNRDVATLLNMFFAFTVWQLSMALIISRSLCNSKLALPSMIKINLISDLLVTSPFLIRADQLQLTERVPNYFVAPLLHLDIFRAFKRSAVVRLEALEQTHLAEGSFALGALARVAKDADTDRTDKLLPDLLLVDHNVG